MTRKDIEKDSERPHYYSQFWLDIAAGRRVIGAPRPEEGELAEPELAPEPVPAPHRRAARNSEPESRGASDGRAEHITYPVAEPATSDDAFSEPAVEELELPANEDDDADYQDVLVEDADIPDMDLSPVEVEEEEEVFDEEVEDEEEDEANWGRGRKKAKPIRPVKPVVKKPGKRDTRRSF